MHHLPHNNTPKVASNPPTSIQIDYSSGHNPKQPKSTKKYIPNGIGNLTMENKIVHGLPTPLHMQHLSTTTMCHFLRLSMVRIFFRAANQAKQGNIAFSPINPSYSVP
jgi:hypothetical protein